MHETLFEEALETITARDPRYHRDAYHFVREALDYTQKQANKEDATKSQRQPGALQSGAITEKHVTGQQLLDGIRDFGLTQFGPMAQMVLEEWGVRNCRDFGEIVFNMVESGWLKKTEKDCREDFDGGYDFHEAFRKPFLPANRLTTQSQESSGSGR
jgi:uncharacterized repeat protein (TIGR04138 family)